MSIISRNLLKFVVTAECGSLTRASELLFITPPPLSRSITALEERFNSKLFIRKSNGLELTEKGKWLYKEVKPILDKLKVIEKNINVLSHTSSHEINMIPSPTGYAKSESTTNLTNVKNRSNIDGMITYSYCPNIALLISRY